MKFFPILEKTKPESVLKVEGKVVKNKESENLELKTGKIELSIKKRYFHQSKELPIPVFGEQDYPEDLRLNIDF